MKLDLPIFTLGLCARVLARPGLEARDDVQTVHLTFHGGPASYSLEFPANGETFATNSDISVNIVDAPDYNAFQQCTFYTAGDKTLVQSIGENGLQQVVVGPPQPITGVSCIGMCVPTYVRGTLLQRVLRSHALSTLEHFNLIDKRSASCGGSMLYGDASANLMFDMDSYT
ncbi:hypothetical protein G7046_g4105 [Stylonectria norvegica]|nr:hypothetical protein G7046_g4105 [Stylonectria norvegica]